MPINLSDVPTRTRDFLSQEEVEALLKGVCGEDEDTWCDEMANADSQPTMSFQQWLEYQIAQCSAQIESISESKRLYKLCLAEYLRRKDNSCCKE